MLVLLLSSPSYLSVSSPFFSFRSVSPLLSSRLCWSPPLWSFPFCLPSSFHVCSLFSQHLNIFPPTLLVCGPSPNLQCLIGPIALCILGLIWQLQLFSTSSYYFLCLCPGLPCTPQFPSYHFLTYLCFCHYSHSKVMFFFVINRSVPWSTHPIFIAPPWFLSLLGFEFCLFSSCPVSTQNFFCDIFY